METLKLETPIAVDAGIAQAVVTYIGMDWEANLCIVRFRECDDVSLLARAHTVQVRGDDAAKLMYELETGVFSKAGLRTTLVQWLQTNGYLPAGEMKGSPEVPVMAAASVTEAL